MHFEFRLKRPTTPKLQLLSDIVVRRKDARGTLTMFCCQNGKRYALTCCHVCYFKKDEENSDHEFFEILSKNQNNPNHVKLHLNSNKYFYNPSENQEIRLGNFSNYILQSNADIIAIEVNENAPVNCRKNGRKERSLKEVCTDLNKQFIKAGPVKVKKYGKEQREGEIVEIAFSYYARQEGFEITDGVLVKCPETFLENGESGVLVYFVDENGKEQAFGYGVAEWCRDLKQKPESPTYKFYLCFKLDIALKELFGKENCETCDCFDQNGNYIDDIKEFTSSNASLSYTTSINSEPSEPKSLKASSSATTSIKSQPSALKLVRDLPEHLKDALIERLNRFHVDVLSEIATNMLEVQYYVHNSADLMAKLKEKKIRFLFREFRRKDQFKDVVLWMRKKFPVGSTGPLNCDDEEKTEKMNFGIRREVSIRLNLENYWETFARHRVMDVTIIDFRKFTKSENPAEEVISRWESKNKSTVGLLYDILVDCELYNIADLL
ncbi:uncharacterized protein LOC124438784 [Xenia sp. Carnegie-2017]|uniref:uncharacterized protein LOC124438784 n=1 Tax=Xenia sp. Carnegie-2017 TaxID=2897299 RepID=UPI001F03390A|nr:uncharacterized protein LOC124438784 [Xenia sp. Carnegie-2017]